MNWKQTLEKLGEAGYTQSQIAQACGCGQATISDLAAGKTQSPRYELGQKILALLAKPRKPAPTQKEVANV